MKQEHEIGEIRPDAPYGYCPICGAKGAYRERRLFGDDICENNHKYSSGKATLEPVSDCQKSNMHNK